MSKFFSDAPFLSLDFFVFKNYHIFGTKNRKCSKMSVIKIKWLKIKPRVIHRLVSGGFWHKKGRGLLSNKHVQNHLIWNILVGLSKITLMGYFYLSSFVKKYKFHFRIQKYQEVKIFEIHCPFICLIARWFSKIFNSQYFLILIENLYFLTKIEREKYPISDILDKSTKIFQIRGFCVSLCDNKPWPFMLSKAA